MITEYKIFEAKQVGVLYHWTYLKSLKEILETEQMISRTLKSLRNNVNPSDIPSWGDYISFSRNKYLNFPNKTCLIIFNGDKLSNNYKFEPHLFTGDLEYKEEAEERIKIDRIPNIKKYIIGIQIKKKELLNTSTVGGRIPLPLSYYQDLIPNIKIEVIEDDNWQKNKYVKN